MVGGESNSIGLLRSHAEIRNFVIMDQLKSEAIPTVDMLYKYSFQIM